MSCFVVVVHYSIKMDHFIKPVSTQFRIHSFSRERERGNKKNHNPDQIKLTKIIIVVVVVQSGNTRCSHMSISICLSSIIVGKRNKV